MTSFEIYFLVFTVLWCFGFRLAMLGLAKEEREQRQAAALSAAQRSDVESLDT